MKTSLTFKLGTAVVAAACLVAAAPAMAGKNSTPGVTTATTSLAAVPPAPAAVVSGGVTSYSVGSTFQGTPTQVSAIRSAPGAVQVTRNGEVVTELTVIGPNGNVVVLVVTASGEISVVDEKR